MFNQKHLQLQVNTNPDLPMIRGEERLLGQILSIMLANAFNYTPSGGTVTVSTHFREAEGHTWAGFRVSDTGLGILPDERDKLFERFYRGSAGEKSGAAGTGLGLPIAKEIIERHAGCIEVESEGIPGKGSCFTVWLPVESVELAA